VKSRYKKNRWANHAICTSRLSQSDKTAVGADSAPRCSIDIQSTADSILQLYHNLSHKTSSHSQAREADTATLIRGRALRPGRTAILV